MEMKCKYCGGAVEKKHRICPHCKKRLKISPMTPVLIALLLVSGGVYLGGSCMAFKQQLVESVQGTFNKGKVLNLEVMMLPAPSGRGIDLLKVVVTDELTAYTQGHESNKLGAGSYPAVFVTADTLQAEYENDEAIAERKYRDKDLFVSGVIASVSNLSGDDYAFTLRRGGNMPKQPKVRVLGAQMDYFTGYEKNRRVNLYCKGAGFIKGSAVVAQCVPSSVWVGSTAEDYVARIKSKIEERDRVAMSMTAFVEILEPFLSEQSACYSPGRGMENQCFSEIEKFSDSAEFKKAMRSTIKRYGDSVNELLIFETALKKADDVQMGPIEGAMGVSNRD